MCMSRRVPTRAVEGYGTGGYQGGVYRGGYQGGYNGWVIRDAIPGYYPAPSPPADQRPKGAGPACGQGGSEAGWAYPGGVDGGGDGPRYHPGTAGARSVPGPSLYLGPCKCRLTANRARFNLILLKVSQNGVVSPKK